MIAEKDGPIGWITFNNPARHNAVSMIMWEALSDIVEDIRNDDAIRVVVVQGAGGKAFVSGADISEFEEKRSSPKTTRICSQASRTASEAVKHLDDPTIAMIRGYCVGGGVSVAMSCACASLPIARAVPCRRPGSARDMNPKASASWWTWWALRLQKRFFSRRGSSARRKRCPWG